MKKFWLIIISYMLPLTLLAQDPQFSQYYASPLYLNPGFAGAGSDHRATLNSRVQWAQLAGAFVTNAVAYDFKVDDLSSGFGIMAMTDKAGSVNLRTSTLSAVYSSKIQLSKEWVFSPGLQFSYGTRMLDFDKLILPDQIEGGNGPSIDSRLAMLGGRNYFDFGAGAVLYNKNLWLGFSSHHLNQPNHSLMGEDARLPIKYSLHAGMKIPIQHSMLSTSNFSSVSPSFVYKQQGPFRQLDAGANFTIDPVLIGFWYRGIPLIQNENGSAHHDALIVILGFNLKYFEMGYSYDLTLSALGFQTGGSHELSMIVKFPGWNPSRVKRKDKILPCPNFSGFH